MSLSTEINSMLKVKQFVFNPFAENTYIVWDSDSREAVVIDPGMTSDSEFREFDDYVAANDLKITQIVNTHLHLDHCFGVNRVKEHYGVKLAANAGDADLGRSVAEQMKKFGLVLPGADAPVIIDVPLKAGDVIPVGAEKLEVLVVPGHSPGGIALYCRAGGFAFVGDSIFAGSIGRTDLPGGNYRTLCKALWDNILNLPPETRLLPGHNGFTTVKTEAQTNPYIL